MIPQETIDRPPTELTFWVLVFLFYIPAIFMFKDAGFLVGMPYGMIALWACVYGGTPQALIALKEWE